VVRVVLFTCESADELPEFPGPWIPPKEEVESVEERSLLQDASRDSALVVVVDQAAEQLDAGADAAAGQPSLCSSVAECWQAVVETHGAGCHGRRSAGAGGFFAVLDVDALIGRGKGVPTFPIDVRQQTRLSDQMGTRTPMSRRTGSSATPRARRSTNRCSVSRRRWRALYEEDDARCRTALAATIVRAFLEGSAHELDPTSPVC